MDVDKAAADSFKEFAETRARKLKGLKLVASLVGAGVAFASGIEKEQLSLWKLAAIWCVVYLAYRVGSYLDKGIFDRLYGANCQRTTAAEIEKERQSGSHVPIRVRLRRTYHAFIDLLPGARMLMYASRAAAAQKLGAGDRTQGPYETAEKLFSHTDNWVDEVKPAIAWSKAARTTAVLLVGLAVYGWLFYPHNLRQ
jgi:hypothetical protein